MPAPASGEFGFQGVELLSERCALNPGCQPGSGVLNARGGDRVDAEGAVGSHRHQSGLPQDPKVLGDGRLRDGPVDPDRGEERPGALLTVGQQFQDAASRRIAQRLEHSFGVQ